jgi:hypothetical protein
MELVWYDKLKCELVLPLLDNFILYKPDFVRIFVLRTLNLSAAKFRFHEVNCHKIDIHILDKI